MTDAREIIARAINYPKEAVGTALPDECLTDWQVRAVQHALHASGFRILGPGEIDGPTLERCVEVADTFEDWGDFGGYLETASGQIASAIRALKEGKE